MAPWTAAAAYECAAAQSMDLWTATKKGLHSFGGDTSSCPGPYPTADYPEFHFGCRLGLNFSPLLGGLGNHCVEYMSLLSYEN